MEVVIIIIIIIIVLRIVAYSTKVIFKDVHRKYISKRENSLRKKLNY